MQNRILFVDDDTNVLSGYKRSLRNYFEIDTAGGPMEGLEKARETDYAVIVSDFKMPGMDGVKFLSELQGIRPDAVRVMLTGEADKDATIAAINQGNIFRYLMKPCQIESLTTTLGDCLKQYELVMTERLMMKETVNGCAKIMTEILSMVNPMVFSRLTRIRAYVGKIAEAMEVPDPWKCELAGMLCLTGCVSLPQDIVQKVYMGKTLNDGEKRLFQNHPKVAQTLLSTIPRFEDISEIIELQLEPYTKTKDKRKCVAMGSQILHAVNDFVQLKTLGLEQDEVLERMTTRSGEYNPEILKAFENVSVSLESYEIQSVGIKDLVPGMIFEENVLNESEMLILQKGVEVTAPIIEKLRNFKAQIGVKEPIRVKVLVS